MRTAGIVSTWMIRLSAIGLVVMTALVGWQVFGRFVLGSSPSWTEQASLVLMIWYVMLASAAGVYEGFHIRITLLEDRLGARGVHIRRFAAGVVLLSGAVLLVYGLQLAWLVRGNAIPSLGISRAVAYAPMPIAGLLMALFALPQLAGGRLPDDESAA